MKFRVVAQMEKKRGFLGSAQRIRLAAILVVITGIAAAGVPVAEAAPGKKGPELSAAEIYKRVRPKIVRIEGKNGGHGTGFYFGEESGLVMTAAHVVASAGSMRVVHANGEVLEKVGAAYRNPGSDLAFLDESKKIAGIPEATDYRVGEKVFVIGHPLEESYVMTEGILAGILPGDEDRSERLTLSIPIWSGMSGSPVLNSRGEVIGLVSGSTAESGGLVRAMSVKEFNKKIDIATDSLEGVLSNGPPCLEKGVAKACYYLGFYLWRLGEQKLAETTLEGACQKKDGNCCMLSKMVRFRAGKIGLEKFHAQLVDHCRELKDEFTCDGVREIEKTRLPKNRIELSGFSLQMPENVRLYSPARDESQYLRGDIGLRRVLNWFPKADQIALVYRSPDPDSEVLGYLAAVRLPLPKEIRAQYEKQPASKALEEVTANLHLPGESFSGSRYESYSGLTLRWSTSRSEKQPEWISEGLEIFGSPDEALQLVLVPSSESERIPRNTLRSIVRGITVTDRKKLLKAVREPMQVSTPIFLAGGTAMAGIAWSLLPVRRRREEDGGPFDPQG